MNIFQHQMEVIDTLRFPHKHSSIERMRSYFFLAVYIIGFIAFIGTMFHYISGLITTLLIQIIELMFIMVYAFNLNDYKAKNVDAMQCERSCNPVIDAYLAVRVLQLLQVFYMGSYVFLLFLAVVGGYTLWWGYNGRLHVDATNLWREINKVELNSFIFIGIEISLLIVAFITMIFSLIARYS